MKLFLAIGAIVLVALLAPLLFKTPGSGPAVADGLPWSVEMTPEGGSRVFGFALGQSTLAEAHGRLGGDLEIAIVAAPGEAGALEAYVARYAAGFVTGSLVIGTRLDPARVAAMRQRAIKTEFMESTTRRIHLHPDDRPTALAAPIDSIAFVPAARLDAAAIVQRFGPPGERQTGADATEHLLYPARGIAITIDPKGRELIQYVAPRDFERLRAPLQSTGAGPVAGRP